MRMPLFEDFAAPPATEPPPLPPGWAEGHAAGLAEGQAACAAQAAALSAATAQALADLAFTFADARHVVLQQLAPLLQLVADRIVPEILQATLGVALAEELAAAAQLDAGAPVPLHLPPDDCAAVAEITAKLAGCPFTVIPDPGLRPGQALVGGAGGTTAFDSPRLAADLADALHALCAEPPRSLAHG